MARPGAPAVSIAALAGGLLPDVPMYVMFGWAKFVQGLTDRDLWPPPDGLYWQPTWQAWTNAGHSVPILLAVLTLGFSLRIEWIKVLAFSGLLHVAFDFPVHREDGHAHLWPFSDWKFMSPVSYWDDNHFAAYVGPIELAIVIGTITVLWRRFSSIRVRAALCVAFVAFFAAPVYFTMLHH